MLFFLKLLSLVDFTLVFSPIDTQATKQGKLGKSGRYQYKDLYEILYLK